MPWLVGERLKALARFINIVRERARCGGLTYVQTARRGAASDRFSGRFNTLSFIRVMYGLDEILDWDLDVEFGDFSRDGGDVKGIIRRWGWGKH